MYIINISLEIFMHETRIPLCSCSLTQSCPTLCNHLDYSLPSSSVDGIFQARILDWVAISSFKVSFQLRDWIHCVLHFTQILYPMSHQGSPECPCCCCCCCVASVVSDSVRPHRRQPTRFPHPWDSPGKNTGVGCHFLLQCMKVKRESEVTQSCPTLATPWTAAYQAPPSMGFSRQKYWSGVPLPYV